MPIVEINSFRIHRNGASTLIKLTRAICKYVGIYGTEALTAYTTPEFVAAVAALVLACHAWEALSATPFSIDRTSPIDVDDVPAV